MDSGPSFLKRSHTFVLNVYIALTSGIVKEEENDEGFGSSVNFVILFANYANLLSFFRFFTKMQLIIQSSFVCSPACFISA